MKESVTGRDNGVVKAHSDAKKGQRERKRGGGVVADAIISQFPPLCPFYSTWVGEQKLPRCGDHSEWDDTTGAVTHAVLFSEGSLVFPEPPLVEHTPSSSSHRRQMAEVGL